MKSRYVLCGNSVRSVTVLIIGSISRKQRRYGHAERASQLLDIEQGWISSAGLDLTHVGTGHSRTLSQLLLGYTNLGPAASYGVTEPASGACLAKGIGHIKTVRYSDQRIYQL